MLRGVLKEEVSHQPRMQRRGRMKNLLQRSWKG